MRRKRRLPPTLRSAPSRDRDADRALFEQAIERLDPRGVDQRHRDAEHGGLPERRARFEKRVSRGDAEPAARLDLHGLDREEAAARVGRFLASVEVTVEVVLIVHGRGAGILRATAIDVLDHHPRVAEHRDAPRNLGGAGARLVRLRRRYSDR